MSQFLNPWSGRQFLDANGDPYVGAQLFSYVSSATGVGGSTKQTLTKDAAGASNHANPIILNARGEPGDGAGASQAMWQPAGVYVKLVLAPAADSDPPTTPISTWDNLGGINDTEVSASVQWLTGPTPTYVGATSFTLVGDQTSDFHVGRRVKTTNTGGTIYSTIITTAFTTLTTVTVVNDSGSLDSGLSAVDYGLLTATNPSLSAEGFVQILGPDIASATALPYPAYGNYSDVTGTTAITSLDTSGEIGKVIKRHFDGILILTHHATNLILPGGANITTAAGDEAEFVEYASGDWRCLDYQLAAVAPITPETLLSAVKTSDEDVTSSTTLQDDDELTITLEANGVYKFESLLIADSASATPDIKLQWTESDGTYDFLVFNWNTGDTVTTASIHETAAASVFALSGSIEHLISFKGTILAGGAGGAFNLQWAQNVSNGTATTVKTGSWMRAVQLN